ncbi:DNA primase, partial [Gordonia terrae]
IALRDEYARQLAGWVGWEEVSQVLGRVREEGARIRKAQGVSPSGGRGASRGARNRPEAESAPTSARPHPSDPRLWPQREALKAALQYPAIAGTVFDSLPVECFNEPAYAIIRQAMTGLGGTSAGLGGAAWVDAVRNAVDDPIIDPLVTELAVESMPVDEDNIARYISSVLARLQEVWVGTQIADIKSRLRRMAPSDDPDGYNAVFGDLVALEAYRRSLLEQAVDPIVGAG